MVMLLGSLIPLSISLLYCSTMPMSNCITQSCIFKRLKEREIKSPFIYPYLFGWDQLPQRLLIAVADRSNNATHRSAYLGKLPLVNPNATLSPCWLPSPKIIGPFPPRRSKNTVNGRARDETSNQRGWISTRTCGRSVVRSVGGSVFGNHSRVLP